MSTQPVNSPECCPMFDQGPWDEKTFEWSDKLFIQDHVCTLFFMPLNFGAVMKRLMAKVDKAGAQVPEYVCLSDHVSRWRMDLYLATDKKVPEAENVTMSGKFFSKVYEGPFRDTGKWMKDFHGIFEKRGMKMEKEYMWYTTCPKCAKKYGRNYTVILAKIS